MAMNIKDSGDSDVMIEMNVTPLIDVMLVLLIMIIITIPVQMNAVRLNLPVGNPPPPVKPPPVVNVYVDFDGTILIDGNVVTGRPALVNYFRGVARQADQPEVHVRANALAPYKYVAEVLAAAQSSGVTKLGVIGSSS